MTRLVSIVGPGGIGKTTVAPTAAEQMVRAFRGGVWLVDFSPILDRSLVAAAVAAASGLAVHSANVTAALCNYLWGRHMLVVLDNCEHLVSLRAAPRRSFMRRPIPADWAGQSGKTGICSQFAPFAQPCTVPAADY